MYNIIFAALDQNLMPEILVSYSCISTLKFQLMENLQMKEDIICICLQLREDKQVSQAILICCHNCGSKKQWHFELPKGLPKFIL